MEKIAIAAGYTSLFTAFNLTEERADSFSEEIQSILAGKNSDLQAEEEEGATDLVKVLKYLTDKAENTNEQIFIAFLVGTQVGEMRAAQNPFAGLIAGLGLGESDDSDNSEN